MFLRDRRGVVAVLAAAFMFAGNAGAAPPLPWAGADRHLGAASCGGSNCHGANRPTAGSPVRQDEYFLWESKDAHSNAYKLLLTDVAKRMAANLGVKAAHEEPACLTCHTDFVPARLRGPRYQLGDGVACEGCHGGAERWNREHVAPGATHAGNVAAGLYPLEDPAARARVCLHCHLGSTEKPIDHRIMGAGHPPLSFELDTFTAIQPAHFNVDADYRERKAFAGSLRTWAVGQTVAAEFFLDGLTSKRFQQAGVFPELVFFDCNACHHPMRPVRWNADVSALGPGAVRLADANLVMTGYVLAAVLPAQLDEWDRGVAALHESTRASAAQLKDAAARLGRIAAAATAAAAARPLGRAEALAMLERILTQGERKAAGDCTAAEQTVYALGVMNEFLKSDKPPSRSLEAPYNAALEAVNCRKGEFDTKVFRDSLRKARDAAQALRAA